MAKEIATNLSVVISKGNSKANGQTTSSEDLAGGFIGFQQNIGLTAESINLGADITAPKVLYIQNLDTTNPVQIDSAGTMDNWPQTLLPGAAVCLRPSAGGSLFAKATGAVVAIWIVAG